MVLHIGNNLHIESEGIIGIFDLDRSTIGKTTRGFLRKAEEKGQIIARTEALPKSFIVVKERGGEGSIYLSGLASSTLGNRLKGPRQLLEVFKRETKREERRE